MPYQRENAVELSNLSESLKLLSEDNLELIHGIEKVLLHSIQPMLLELFSDSDSDKCARDLKYVQESYSLPRGMRMLDSYGKPGSGILQGNIKWLGEYDECLDVQAPPKENTDVGSFRGRYCSLQIPLKSGPVSLPISTAVCLPDSCKPNGTVILRDANLDGILSGLDTRMGALFNDATLSCKATSKKVTAGAIVTIFLLSIFVLLVLIGSSITAFEYFVGVENASQDDAVVLSSKKKIMLPAWLENNKPILNCFCLFTNGEKLLDTAGAEGQLPCLHGLRFMSISWVILSHCYGVASSFSKNGVQALSIIDHWTFQAILNGYYAVDSFFVLSGFLVAYVYFKQADKTDGKIPWLYFYVNRYISNSFLVYENVKKSLFGKLEGKVLDSYGKPESGILVGNLKWLGQYDECVGVQAPSKENTSVGGFRGNYCTLQVPLKLGSVTYSSIHDGNGVLLCCESIFGFWSHLA
ncbi:hypothetical protein AVEN_116019-1 [Araneus ventricosus]|uniref:Nose resistant-to-fluoxetine protein N-terminal domain-containing protein n=1 Tax=Araneus ventricosus TaxID=182803 RepID=A0A4Y2MYQ9_ARAVE|nr:hypothetical protein AVEN_116019-1 [Araneus ventricosus]